MRILITGSSGMLGSDICDVLGGDHETTGLDLYPSKEGAPSPEGFIEADITEADAVKKLVAAVSPDVIIHTAAWTDVDGCETDPEKAYRINADGAENVARAAKGSGATGIFISTDFVFDGSKSSPYSEDDACAPLGIYGKSKHEAEKRVRDSGCDHVIVRTSWLFGKNGNNFVDTIKSAAASGKELRVVGDQVGSPTYTRDLAGALSIFIDHLEAAKGGIVNISNKGECSWCEFACNIVPGVKVYPITTEELGRPAPRPKYSALDNTKFEEMTGSRMRTWQEALKDYLERESL